MKLCILLLTASALRIASAANVANTGPNWPGWAGLSYHVVFGDSYTTVGFNSTSPIPTAANPIGVTYPGTTTSGGANWVDLETVQFNASKSLAFDYAVYGAAISGVQTQIQDFLSGAGKKPAYAPWTGSNSLFAVWIGVNDIAANAQPAASMTSQFNLMETLYTNGARNFLFVNIPPFDRAPAGNGNTAWASAIPAWNTAEQAAANSFKQKHPDIATFYYDVWSLFTKLLNNPSQYGFTDTTKAGGSFYQDVIHPTVKVHQYLAEDLVNFLKSVPAGTSTSTIVSPTTTPSGTSTTPVPSPTTTPLPTPTPTPPPTPTTTAGPQQTHYGQCGGQGYTGPTVCVSPYTCKASNQYYSQCL